MADWMVPLLVAVPLLAAAVLMAAERVMGAMVRQSLALLVALFVCLTGAYLSARCAAGGAEVYWFGGWTPRRGWVPGICFQLDSLNCMFAAVAGGLTANALLFSWRYFKEVKAIYESLLMIFLAAMCGFVLTGDLFNLFVYLELMGVCAYALTAYKVEEEAAVAGGLNFAVTNSLGAYCMLMGLGLLYARTSALNLAFMGSQLNGGPTDGLVLVGCALLLLALLTKGAVAPFHMWLADAHAVAPAPVSSLFSGVMVSLGIFGVCRVLSTAFVPLHLGALGPGLVGLGVLTALLGGCMSVLQRHWKRMLAFSTISHTGLALMGVGLLSPEGGAGGLHYLLSHGLVKASLFLNAGAMLDRTGEIDEYRLQGRGRTHRALATLYLLGWLALMGCPPFGIFRSKEMLERAGPGWFAPVLALSTALTGVALARAGARVFWGLGSSAEEPAASAPAVCEEGRDTHAPPGPAPLSMVAAAAFPLLGALWLGLDEGAAQAARASVALWMSRPGYFDHVLHGARGGLWPSPLPSPELSTWLWLAATLGFAVVGAFLQLRGSSFPLPRACVGPLRALHSGRLGDYLLWMTLGFCLLAGALLFG